MPKKVELVLLSILLCTAGFIRFYQLGFSHFYGDEIKTLYLRKDVSAFTFLMDQRKGPGQFFVSWLAEKLSGGYNEFAIRLPYALAGMLLVLVFYIFVRQHFGSTTAVFSTAFFSLNGFYIAFSRIAQYQVLYLLFGFLGLILAKLYTNTKKPLLILGSGLCLALSLLCHYDAVFFLIPLVYVTGKPLFLKLTGLAAAVSLVFYLPNILLGFFNSNTFGYIAKRLAGENYLKNSSLYTMAVYNPFYIYLVVLCLCLVLAVFKVQHKAKNLVLAWAVLPFVLFQLVILNPGTHIHNYLLPVIILSGLGLEFLVAKAGKWKIPVLTLAAVLFSFIYYLQLWVFVPAINTGYPWKLGWISNQYNLYLYGFPYNRDWDKLGAYVKTLGGVRNFYTNDTETIAEYYLYGIPYSAPGIGFTPQYYIEVNNPHELKKKEPINMFYYKEISGDFGPNIKLFRNIPRVQN